MRYYFIPNRRFMALLLVLAFVFAVSVTPALAQDEPVLESALSQTEIVLVVALVIAVVVISIFSATILSLAKQGFNALPPWAAELVRDASVRGVLELEEIVVDTPNTIDDELAKKIREIVEEVVSVTVQEAMTQAYSVGAKPDQG